VLELAGRLGAPVEVSGAAGAPVAPAAPGDRRDEVVEALVGLGWNTKAAQDAVGGVVDDDVPPVSDADVAGVLRAALRALGSGRG
jgi:Holliday junction DNA helicase RuvA